MENVMVVLLLFGSKVLENKFPIEPIMFDNGTVIVEFKFIMK
jgi:hypothetical protein